MRVMKSPPDMDYFVIVPQYDREFCDPIVSASFDGSMSRHGKLFIRELDLRSVDSNQFWGRWKEPFWQETHSRATFRRKAMHYAADAIVVAQSSGEKCFRLPKGRNPVKVLAGANFTCKGDGVFSVPMKIGEIFVLGYR